ncbi:DNA polymerase III subunit beta family protein [Candidatus Vidania fulgoroideorum]
MKKIKKFKNIVSLFSKKKKIFFNNFGNKKYIFCIKGSFFIGLYVKNDYLKIKKKKLNIKFYKTNIKIKRVNFLKVLNFHNKTLRVLNNKYEGININIKKNKIFFTSTDGYRINKNSFKQKNKEKIKFRIKKKNFLLIKKIINIINVKNINIRKKRKKIYLKFGNFILITKVKNYVSYITKKTNFKKIKFENNIKQIIINTKEDFFINIFNKKRKIFLKTNYEKIFIKKSKIKINIYINYKFFIDFLKFKKEKFYFYYMFNNKRIIMKYKKNYECIIMPILF